MRKFKGVIYWLIAVIISGTVFLFSVVLSDVCIFYQGFSVDYQGNIYIGKQSSIDVYVQNGHKIQELDAYTNRGYQFTIVDGKKVFLNATGRLFVLDLDGNVLQGPKNISEIEYGDRPEFSYRKFSAADGNTYVLKSPLWRPTVFCLQDDGTLPVYQMPLLDYFIRLLISGVWISGWIVVILFLRKQYQNHSAPVNSHTKGSLYSKQWTVVSKKEIRTSKTETNNPPPD